MLVMVFFRIISRRARSPAERLAFGRSGVGTLLVTGTNLKGALRGSSSAWRMLSLAFVAIAFGLLRLFLCRKDAFILIFSCSCICMTDRSYAPAPRSRWIVRGGATRSVGLSLTTCQVWATPFFCLRLRFRC